jgi:hypothetical protein
MQEYGLSGSATYSVELSGLDAMMQLLPNNNFNQISARNVRDIVYTLWLNGGGGGGSFSYTQGAPLTDKSTIGVGGIPAQRNFIDVALQTLFDEMFFPPLDNEYSISGGASFEFGTSNPTINFTVTLTQKNSTAYTLASVTSTSARSTWPLNNIQVSPAPELPTGKDDSRTSPYTSQPVDQNEVTTYSLVVREGTTTLTAKTVKATWFSYRYYGVLNLTTAYGNEFDVSKATPAQLDSIFGTTGALNRTVVLAGSKSSSQLGEVTFTNPNGYHIWMVWPSSDYTAGIPSKFIFNNNEVNVFTFLGTKSFMNANGYTRNYNFFISNRKQSSITLNII